MKDTIRITLLKLLSQFGESIFINHAQFKAGVSDILGSTNDTLETKKSEIC